MTTHTPTYFADLANFNADDFHGVITCADGLEQALVIELESFGLAPKILRAGRVLVSLNLAKLYHICLFSRVASRVLLPLGEYHFKQKMDNGIEVLNEDVPEALYQFTTRIDWTKLFGLEHRFAIRLSTDKRLTVNQQFATLRIKDAIADTFNRAFGARPDVDAKSPDFQIFAAANNKFAELFLDLSGTSLHRRGYRVANTAAPLKENLASALLYECGWHKGEFDAIIDPMCGSGTFITEALLMRANYPVGLDKVSDEFGFYCWQHHDEDLWDEVVANAQNQFHNNLDKLQNSHLTVIAFDADAHAVQACHKNLMASGLSPILHKVQLEQRSVAQLSGALEKITTTNLLVITNPPYGERLGDSDFIKPLYHGVGLQVSAGLRTAGVSDAYMAVLASHIEHADTLPIIEPNTLRCHNGALTVYFRHGKLNLSPLPSLIRDYERRDVQIDDAQEFINRLQKNLANLKKQAVRQGVTNLRVYDADLPNFNVAIDVYGDKIHVQEYAPPKQIPADVAKARFNLVLHSVREVFGVARESIFIKTRARQSGNEQYTKNETTKRKKMWVASEDGAYFYVNFTEYLDTGLFIDHRNMRGLVKSASRGKRVLNLFSYTCSASVHAALGGAKCVTSVDLSGNYLDWGKQNFALNGLVLDAFHEDELKYQFISEDTFEWIKNNTEQYDVIFIDPPTFSNSKKFKGTFDVQRDHVALINRAMNRLSAGGVLYFSNNYTRFELDESLMARYNVKNITHETIGFDFDIKKPIHQSFEIRHKNAIKTAQIEVHDDNDMPNDRNQAYQRVDKADKKPFAKSLDKSSGRTSDKPSDKAFKSFDKPVKGDCKTFERGDKKHLGKKDFDKSNFAKPNKAAQGKPFGKSQSKQFGSQTDKTQAIDKPSIKRVYVNPKLADGERLAQSLTQKLNDKLSDDVQATSRYRIKRKD
ncbi:bifunctional 23S rRNA (guanine(2069)-N(7))-methyltransferase RlmK/23S rRNA (guanine(2445)-N(2))-methyltransferase RlmL [uncultured Moraxella sp.]|uniref:bifunctional 23S rRNA (guanine(2069)-N(7))-methyltransferase RlmK/23S rRNA (guanine(2445)-N(2))-methyltransferase RlmL n=1 Tax=uncultured Moraxella sp. TaxID=263769 RepID=UPI0025E7BA9E|nr:bifunctional 23S rRNA (guanine(2069)-N(7))-methyltransferase RlmK/23S rRNA (guanine(2445)-N(2))-methyltransferase RlmL [uncultured Moraxella sp.]